MKSFKVVCSAWLFLLAVACGPAATMSTPQNTPFDSLVLRVASYRFQDMADFRTGIAIHYQLAPGVAASDVIVFSLAGPPGWNGGNPHSFTFPVEALSGASYLSFRLAEVPLAAGEFVLSASIGSTGTMAYARHTATLSGLAPLNAQVTLRREHLSANWHDSSPVGRYLVRLYKGQYEEAVNTWFVARPDLNVDVALEPGDYLLVVDTMNREDLAPPTEPSDHNDLASWVVWPLTVD